MAITKVSRMPSAGACAVGVLMLVLFRGCGSADIDHRSDCISSTTMSDTGRLPIYVVANADSLQHLGSVRRAVVFADAPWSVHAETTKQGLFSLAFSRTAEGETDVSFYIVTERQFANLLEFIAAQEKAVPFDAGSRERGAFLLILSDGTVRSVDPDPKHKIAAELLKHEIDTAFD